MPRTKEQYDLIKEERKEAILNASFSLYALKVDKLTIDDICANCKCSHGIIYRYFKNVDDIVDKIYKSQSFVSIKSKMLTQLESGDNPLENAKNLLRYMLAIYDEKTASIALIILRETGKNSLRDKLFNIIEKGQQSYQFIGGEISDIIDVLFSFFKGKYLDILLNKKQKIAYPSIDNVMNIITRH